MSEHLTHADPPGIVGRKRVTVAEAEATPLREGQRSAPVLAHGGMVARFYAPRGVDEQTPHTRDELYVVARGSGAFVNGGERHPFGEGDALFVPAGVEHRFEDFTALSALWAVEDDPEGGERGPGGAGSDFEGWPDATAHSREASTRESAEQT